MYEYRSIKELMQLATITGEDIIQIIIGTECEEAEITIEQVRASMHRRWDLMQKSIFRGIESPQVSTGGLIGGNAVRLICYQQEGNPLLGTFASRAVAYALSVSEVNASMGRIVAAPTAGSSGILPGVLQALAEEDGLDADLVVNGLFIAAAVGRVIGINATLSGAQGGCQAECGAAAAMAAAAAVYLRGGNYEQAWSAAAMAIKNLLGLVCDPVAGLVEVPCSKRNAAGVAIALVCADMALSGISSVIPLDEMIDALDRVGRSLPNSLRETAQGGCAATPTARRIWEQLKNE